jgi:hypothetical protein
MGFRTSSIVRSLKNWKKNMTFRKLVQWLRLALSNGPNRVGVSPHLRAETDPVSETSCFLPSNSLESGRWTKSENPLTLCVKHHRQNLIEYTEMFFIYNRDDLGRSSTSKTNGHEFWHKVGTRYRSGLRRYAASRKVAGSSPDKVDFFKLT